MFIIPKVTNVSVPDPHGIRTIVFSDAFEKAGVNSGTMTRLSVPGFKLLRHIASSTPTEEDLIDGAIYTFSLEYQDRQQNAKAVVNHTDVTYAGVDTLAPVFYLPAASSHIPIEFYFDVEILEKALPGIAAANKLSWRYCRCLK